MMQNYEAKTVEDAVKAAAEDKHVTPEELKYVVVEEKQGGLFGLGSKAVIKAYCVEDQREFIAQYLQTYFADLGLPVEITVAVNPDGSFKADINAENNAILIGKNGQTMESIKTVVNAAANAQFKCHVNLALDINGYKEERYDKLRDTVDKIAATVVKTHVSARLGDLTSDERKVVHQHLANTPHIRTASEGDGSNRRLKISYDKDKE